MLLGFLLALLCVMENPREKSGEEALERRRVMENLLFPRDLLQRFISTSTASSTTASTNVFHEEEDDEEEDLEDLELNLGLSLGGRFGVDKSSSATRKSKTSKLVRSSSIIGTVPFVRDESPAPAYSALMRTASLPAETEEEWRKRKEIQTMRRMAAKRRRSEKQRNSGAGKAAERDDDCPPPSVSRQNTISGGVDLAAAVAIAVAARSCSSGVSELDSRAGQGSSSYGETRSSTAGSQETVAPGPSGTKMAENKCSTSGTKTENPSRNKGREIGMNAMEDMPCVFTKGDGPNGRRVDGILYRYGKGEEVRIMCVCHGKFLSPAEFVKHAGGGDVDHPLRHIVINPSSSSFL